MDTCLAKQWRAGRRALAVMVPAGPAAAQFVEQTVDGALDSVQPNPFGISDGDLFSIEAFYDEMLLSGLGLETIDLGEGTGHGFSLDIANGALTFSEVDDLFFGAPFSDPEVFFLDGCLPGSASSRSRSRSAARFMRSRPFRAPTRTSPISKSSTTIWIAR